MHGLPVAEEIVETVIRSIGEKPLRVKEIEIEMGPDSTIGSEELEFCLQMASESTVVEGSKINITLKPGLVECLECGKKEQKTQLDRIPTCSSCYSTNIKVEEKGIVLKNIKFEEENE